MKTKLRNGLIALVIAASMTTWFTGCGSKPEPFNIPAGSGTIISESQSPQSSKEETVPGADPSKSDTERDMFTKYWYNSASTQTAKAEVEKFKKDNQLVVTEKTMLGGLIDVYASGDSEVFISGFTPQQLKGGKISANQLVSLRLEGSGQRVYVMDNQDDVDGTIAGIKGLSDLLIRNDEVQPADISARVAAREEMIEKLATMEKANTVVAVNGSAIAGRNSFANGTVGIADLSDASLGVLVVDATDTTARTITLKVNAAAETFTVVFTGDETGKLTKVMANGVEITKDLSGCLMGFTNDVQLYLTPAAIQSTLGFDVEVYANANVINVVTDEMDIMSTDNVVVDTPAVAEAEKSTAGAASEAQAKTDYTQKQQQQKEPSQPTAPTKPTAPSSSSSTPTAPPASSKPSGGVTQDDVNDLLNEVLGGGGSSSKPSGGGSSGAPGLVEGNRTSDIGTPDGSELGRPTEDSWDTSAFQK